MSAIRLRPSSAQPARIGALDSLVGVERRFCQGPRGYTQGHTRRGGGEGERFDRLARRLRIKGVGRDGGAERLDRRRFVSPESSPTTARCPPRTIGGQNLRWIGHQGLPFFAPLSFLERPAPQPSKARISQGSLPTVVRDGRRRQ